MTEASKFIKGQILLVKAPPYYKKEYPYVITKAGDKVVSANLQNSPKVKKSWTVEELEILFANKIISFADQEK